MVDIAERLAQGGRFLWADITTAPTPLLEQLFIDDWVVFMRQAGLEEEHIEHVLEDHRLNDLPERVETMLGCMQRAGFDPAALTWLRGKFAVLLGRRSR